MKKPRSYLYSLIAAKRLAPEQNVLKYAYLLSALFCSFIMLLSHGIFFIISQDFILLLLCLAGIGITAASVYYFSKNLFGISANVLFAGLTLYTTICIILLGGGKYFILFYLTLFFFQIIFPHEKTKTMVFSGVLMFCLALLGAGGTLLGFEGVLSNESTVHRLILGILNVVFTFLFWSVFLFAKRTADDFAKEATQRNLEEDGSYIDSLTQLYNENFAKKYLDELSQTCGNETYIAIVDMDNLTEVNEAYGYAAGDMVIKRVAEILVKNMQKTDLVFRWRGEGLLILLNERLSEANQILEKIRALISEEVFRCGTSQFKVTVTVGVVRLDIENIAKSLDLCDKKVYIGKKTGKNIVVM